MIGIILCLCAVLVPAAASAAAARAHQAPTGTATVTVTPSSGLFDGQSIGVTGNSFTAKTVYGIIECPTGASKVTGCDLNLGNIIVVKTDGSGSFSTSMTAVRTITPGTTGTPVDCATAGACVLAVAPRNGKIAASTAISFADVVIIAPTISADPSSGLLDGQSIAVTGNDFSAGAQIALAECPAGGDPTENVFNCDVTTFVPAFADGSGNISSPYTATRIIAGPTGSIDCAQPSACVLVAFNLSNPSQAASTPISFQDIAIVPPVLLATPSTGLVDGQVISVTGKGFKRHGQYALSECVAGSTDGSECVATAGIGNVAVVTTKGSGRFTTTIEVARVLTLINGTVDCAQAPGCVIGAIDASNPFGSVSAVTPVSFNPNVKPLPPLNLQLHIDPTGQIVAGSRGGEDPQISGTISCARTTPLPVQFQMQVTQPNGGLNGGAVVLGEATCQRGGAKFAVTVPTPKRYPAEPGIAGVLLAVSAVSGSATQSVTISASVTLKAPAA
jgi:hypothetical protein